MPLTVAVGHVHSDRQQVKALLGSFLLEEGASVLTLQPCGWLSGCARRLKEPARVYPSGPAAAPAPLASLEDTKQGQGSRVKRHCAPAATAPEGLTIKGEVADEFGWLVAAGRLQEGQQLRPELPQVALLLPRSNSRHSYTRRVFIYGQNQAAVPTGASLRDETCSVDQREKKTAAGFIKQTQSF